MIIASPANITVLFYIKHGGIPQILECCVWVHIQRTFQVTFLYLKMLDPYVSKNSSVSVNQLKTK
jgi:hypothetical protein